MIRSGSSVNNFDAVRLFRKLNSSNSDTLSKKEFVDGLLKIKECDMTKQECERLFHILSVGNVSLIKFVEVFLAHEEGSFEIPQNFNYQKSTTENYVSHDRIFVGSYVDIRETRDYEWHSNYSPERQIWQDLGKTEAQARPWIIYTCGPMGVGKGHVLAWLSQQGLFPAEYIVHVDPDFFKRIMPEWNNYLAINEEFAGTACHQESAYLQEIAQEVAMRQRQHVWVDGSLSDGDWFSKIFDDIRQRFPHYRIAIFHISASEATIRQRIAKRTKETGRSIPEIQIIRSLENPENSIRLLAPKTDLVVRIWNESSIVLKSVEDHSGDWVRGLGRLFSGIQLEQRKFPESLGPIYLERTSLVGQPFTKLNDQHRGVSNFHHAGYLDKQGQKLKHWKTRWFILRDNKLCYYEKKDAHLELCGEIPIDENTIIDDNNDEPVIHRQHLLHLTSMFPLLRRPSGSDSDSTNHDHRSKPNRHGNNHPTANGDNTGGDNDDDSNRGGSDHVNASFQYNNSIFIIKTQPSSEIHHSNISAISASKNIYASTVFDANTVECKLEWINALRAEIRRCKQQHFTQLGFMMNRYIHLRLTDKALMRSPNLRQLASSLDTYSHNLNEQQTTTTANNPNPLMTRIDTHSNNGHKNNSHYTSSSSSSSSSSGIIQHNRINDNHDNSSSHAHHLSQYSPNSIDVLASPQFSCRNDTEEYKVGGISEGAVHMQFNVPCKELLPMIINDDNIDANDPDILLLLHGGFTYYNDMGLVIGTVAVSDTPSQYSLHFGPPEHLNEADAERLHISQRWLQTDSKYRDQGAKYFTYVLPGELLVTRKFPSHGSFAFLFHNLDEPSDARDCYFSIIVAY